MDGPDINSTTDPNAQANFQPVNTPPPTESIPAPGQVEYDQNASTMSQSDQQLMAELYLAMQIPGLFPPNMFVKEFADLASTGKLESIGAVSNSDAINILAMKYEQAKNDIITSIWENFAKSVQELEQLSKEAYIKKWVLEVNKEGPKSSTEYYAFLLALSASRRAEELGESDKSALSVQFNTLANQWLNVPSDNSMAVTNDRTNAAADVQNPAVNAIDSSFKVGTLASNADVMSEAIAVASAIGAPRWTVSPVADAVFAVGPNTGLPLDSQAAAALVAALLYGGIRNKTDVETLENAAKQAQPPQDLDFALNYAKNILALVSQKVEGEDTANKEQAGQHQMIRLMLSIMALNLIYRAGYGGMEGSKEFTALLQEGGTDDIDPAIKPTIDNLIAKIKEFLPADEPNRSQMIASLSEYIDSKDSVESMLSTTRMFAASLNAKPDISGGRLGATSA